MAVCGRNGAGVGVVTLAAFPTATVASSVVPPLRLHFPCQLLSRGGASPLHRDLCDQPRTSLRPPDRGRIGHVFGDKETAPMPLVLNSRAPGGRGHRATSNELRKADSPSLPGPSDQGQSGDGASPETASWSRPPCWLGLAASRGPGQPPLSPKPRCAPLPPGAAGLPSLQARLPPASTSGSGRRPPSSPTFSVASGTSPPPPAAHSGFCHPDASQTNLSGLTSLSFLRLSGQGTASLPPGRPSRWPP